MLFHSQMRRQTTKTCLIYLCYLLTFTLDIHVWIFNDLSPNLWESSYKVRFRLLYNYILCDWKKTHTILDSLLDNWLSYALKRCAVFQYFCSFFNLLVCSSFLSWFCAKMIYLFDSGIRLFRSWYAWSVSCQLTVRLSDHLYIWIDIIFIFLVKAWPRSEYFTKCTNITKILAKMNQSKVNVDNAIVRNSNAPSQVICIKPKWVLHKLTKMEYHKRNRVCLQIKGSRV